MFHVASIVDLALFCALLFGLPILMGFHPRMPVKVSDAFCRSGALAFRGEHAVLPPLEQQTATTGWTASNDFLAGYGAAQTVPGPLFIFTVFLGWTIKPGFNHWARAALTMVGILLPG